ncbi:VOC family protein [Actinosynnema sp. NPDC020468]|uniref:VOC family protein n=1 Tax=Actinosynnema sp. NPDC020468 TaxID=3154488 RepID=UPI003403A4D7
MSNSLFGDNVGFVAKLDVTDLQSSTEWYADSLGLFPDPRYQTRTWSQLNVPGLPGIAIGLDASGGSPGTGGSTPTFVVADIQRTVAELTAKGVKVGEITPVGEGVQLAFFSDPDSNELGLRQNGPTHPGPEAVGRA